MGPECGLDQVSAGEALQKMLEEPAKGFRRVPRLARSAAACGVGAGANCAARSPGGAERRSGHGRCRGRGSAIDCRHGTLADGRQRARGLRRATRASVDLVDNVKRHSTASGDWAKRVATGNQRNSEAAEEEKGDVLKEKVATGWDANH